MAKWTAQDIPKLSGLTAVVTGANSGIGFHTAAQLAGHGAHVVLACRDQGRGAEAAARVRSSSPDASVELASLNLADLASVRNFGAAFVRANSKLDILVNNAGVMAIPRSETADGFEMQFGTNHLGHFALTGLLLPALLRAKSARVVTVSSLAANGARIRFGDLQGRRHYWEWSAYGQSKLANQLFALELNRRVVNARRDLVSVLSHPGYAATNLSSAGQAGAIKGRLIAIGDRFVAQSDREGAWPSLYAATAPDVKGGDYFGPDHLFGARGNPTRTSPVRAARDPESAKRLWEVSENLTGVRYDALEA